MRRWKNFQSPLLNGCPPQHALLSLPGDLATSSLQVN